MRNEMNLGKFEDKTPFCLNENNKTSNHHSITPEYSIEDLLGGKDQNFRQISKCNDCAQRGREEEEEEITSWLSPKERTAARTLTTTQRIAMREVTRLKHLQTTRKGSALFPSLDFTDLEEDAAGVSSISSLLSILNRFPSGWDYSTSSAPEKILVGIQTEKLVGSDRWDLVWDSQVVITLWESWILSPDVQAFSFILLLASFITLLITIYIVTS